MALGESKVGVHDFARGVGPFEERSVRPDFGDLIQVWPGATVDSFLQDSLRLSRLLRLPRRLLGVVAFCCLKEDCLSFGESKLTRRDILGFNFENLAITASAAAASDFAWVWRFKISTSADFLILNPAVTWRTLVLKSPTFLRGVPEGGQGFSWTPSKETASPAVSVSTLSRFSLPGSWRAPSASLRVLAFFTLSCFFRIRSTNCARLWA